MARSVCAEPGCPVLTYDGTCEEHRRPRGVEDRASPRERGYDREWREYSEAYRRVHPWCRTCEAEGRHTRTDLVDHVTPVSGRNDPGFWDANNHQPLCRGCHAVKTRSEGRTQRDEPAPVERWVIL